MTEFEKQLLEVLQSIDATLMNGLGGGNNCENGSYVRDIANNLEEICGYLNDISNTMVSGE